jgi:hypothetical protein
MAGNTEINPAGLADQLGDWRIGNCRNIAISLIDPDTGDLSEMA